jgi:large subunit ribosomal protein L5
MFFVNSYLRKTVRYDLINAFFLKNLTQIPSFKKIVINFGYQQSSLKYIILGLLALEHISWKKGKLTQSKRLSVFLKIKKGTPVGCKVTLKRDFMYSFYLKLITVVLPRTEKFKSGQPQKNLKLTKAVSFEIKNPLLFFELENQYQFFKNLPKMNVTLLLDNTKSSEEFSFFLKSIKLFI